MSKSKLRIEYEARFGVVAFYLRLYDAKGNEIYFETPDGWWVKKEFDDKGKEIYYEDSSGYWLKQEYDAKGNEIYHEDRDGYWIRREYDAKGNEIYQEESVYGVTLDNRPCSEKVFIDEQTGKKFKMTEVK